MMVYAYHQIGNVMEIMIVLMEKMRLNQSVVGMRVCVCVYV